jgi:hypothetical protein
MQELGNFNTMRQARSFHESKGLHFFSKGAKSFFSSRISECIYGRCVFVTSEKFGWKHPRLYTIRYIDTNGNINTYNDFQGYETRSSAHHHAKKLGEWITNTREEEKV